MRGLDPPAAAALLPILSQRGPAALRISFPPTSLPTELLARVRAREQRARRLHTKVFSEQCVMQQEKAAARIRVNIKQYLDTLIEHWAEQRT